MKRKLLISCMTAVAALLTTSCTSDLALLEGGTTVNGVDGEEVEVTFSVSAENSQAVTRGDEEWSEREVKGPGQWQQTIGRGTKIDMLIYAVYEYDKETDKSTLLKQYGKGIAADFTPAEGNEPDAISQKRKSTYDGQTVVKVDADFQKGKPYPITLRLMRNKDYRIAFWAQSSQTTAYETDSLTGVKVNYKNGNNAMLNNDETRDAFCKVETFSVGASEVHRTVVLTRPLAQINVGTTGADYARVVNVKGRKFTQSTITLSGVAQYINVVTDKILVDKEKYKTTNVTFAYNTIPAFLNMEIPAANEENKNAELIGSTDVKDNKEEFLFVDLDYDGNIMNYEEATDNSNGNNGYQLEYPTIKDNKFTTETFKYLSMCYVLVPADTRPLPEDAKDMEPYTSSVLENVSVTFDENPSGDAKGGVELTYVPVHRNWRTNILCGLYSGEVNDPTPDDPTSIFNVATVRIIMNRFFNGEYNTTDDGNSWTQETFNQDNQKARRQ